MEYKRVQRPWGREVVAGREQEQWSVAWKGWGKFCGASKHLVRNLALVELRGIRKS